MKIKQIAMISVIIAVLLISFILPRQMLRYEQNKTMQDIYTENLSEALSFNYNMTLAEKLQLLTQTDVQTVVFEMSMEQQKEVASIMQQELMKLKEIGFVDTALMLDGLLQEEIFDVYNIVYIDAERILRAYEIAIYDRLLVMDVDSGKILQINAFSAHWERAESALNAQVKGEKDALSDLESWAKYYDMQLVDGVINSDYRGKENGWAIVSGCFVEDEGSRVSFALNFNIRDNLIRWGPMKEEIPILESEAAVE